MPVLTSSIAASIQYKQVATVVGSKKLQLKITFLEQFSFFI